MEKKTLVVYPNTKDIIRDEVDAYYGFEEEESSIFFSAMNYMADYYVRKFSATIHSMVLSHMEKTTVKAYGDGQDYDKYDLKIEFHQYFDRRVSSKKNVSVELIHPKDALLIVVTPEDNTLLPDSQIYLESVTQKQIFENPYLDGSVISSMGCYLLEMIYEKGALVDAYIGMDKHSLTLSELLYKLRQDYHKGFNEGLIPVGKDDYPKLDDINTDLYDIYIRSLVDYKVHGEKTMRKKFNYYKDENEED